MMYEAPMEWRESWWHSPSDMDRRFGAWPVRAGRTRTKPHYHAGPRVKPDYSIHFILGGTARFSVRDGADAALCEGDAFVIFPQKVHEYWAMPSDPPRMMWVAFQGPAAGAVLSQLGLSSTAPVLKGLEGWRLSALAGRLADVFNGRSPDSLYPVAFLTMLFADLLDDVGKRAPNDVPWLDRGRQLLEQHCTDNVTVQEIAEHIGVDRSHFSKEFTKEFGTSPARYLRDARLEHARELLKNSTLTATEIALSVGYGDLYAFSHAYRRRFGRPPSAEQAASGWRRAGEVRA